MATQTWEYDALVFSHHDYPLHAPTLNKPGRLGWECYHVHISAGFTTYFLRRRTDV